MIQNYFKHSNYAMLLSLLALIGIGKASAQTYTTFSTGVTTPAGLTFDTSGNLYVCQYTTTGNVMKVTPGGAATTFSQTTITNPSAIVTDGVGNFYTNNIVGGNSLIIKKINKIIK